MPVPNANTRVEGALAGQFHYADLLPIEALGAPGEGARQGGADHDAVVRLPLPRAQHQGRRDGAAGRCARPCRPRIGEGEMLAAGFGDTRFFIAEGNHFPKGTPFYSAAGTDRYNERDPQEAKAQAEQAGYKGEPVRILTSRQYDFHYNMALIMAEQLKRAGFKAELNVVEWATLLQRRDDPKLWDIYITHSGLFPEPMLSPPQLGDGAPGWWSIAGQAGRAGGTQPGARPGQARAAVGQGAAGGLRRGALHPGRQVREPVGARAGAAGLQARHLPVLLEHRA